VQVGVLGRLVADRRSVYVHAKISLIDDVWTYRKLLVAPTGWFAQRWLLHLLRRPDDPQSHAGNPAYCAAVAAVEPPNAIALDPPAAAMGPRYWL